MSIGKSSRWILGFFGVKKSPNLPQVDCTLDGGRKEPPVKRVSKEKRRWSLGGRKASSTAHFELDHKSPLESNDYIPGKQTFEIMDMEQDQQKSKHAMVVAAASAAAAEAALAAASAAAAVARLTANGLSWNEIRSNVNMERELAAIKIQTAFRGHLARRALRALKAVVRLQALFRGHKVRKQAAMTLQCMQALVKVQSRARAHARARACASARSHAGMPEEAHTLQLQYLSQRQRNQQARPRTSVEEGNGSSGRKDKLQAKVEKKQQAAMNCERALAYEPKQYSKTPGWSWIERWMVGRSPVLQNPKGGKAAAIGMERSSEASSRTFGPNRSFRSKNRMGSTADSFSFDLNTSSSLNSTAIHTSPSPLVESFRSTDRSPANRVLALKQRPNSIPHLVSSFASTPSQSWRSRASVGGLHPRTKNHILEQEDYDSSSSADSSLAFSHSARHTGIFGLPGMDQKENMLHFPNYMTATKSTKAKVRSQSAPKQRPAGSEKHSPAPSAGRKRFSPSWADKLYYARRGSEEKSQFQRSVSQVRTRNKVSAASELMDNWSLRDDGQYW